MTQGNAFHSELQRVRTLADVSMPAEAVVVADRRLPEQLLRAVPDAVLVEAGERLKTLSAIEDLAAEVLRRRTSRPLLLVALGGGSVGDAVGFLASILWRGVDLWQIPTTLLAMVDSAHGGKTAVNLGPAKNQLGTFYPAGRVLIVEEVLASLPLAQRREGVVELLKALWLGDAAGVRALKGAGMQELIFAPFADVGAQLGNMIEAAVAIKQGIVEKDPREELGLRTVLNLGHTVGHALELTTGLGHGASVAWGLAASLRFSRDAGMSVDDEALCRETLFPLLQPLTALPSRDVLRNAMLRDKKRSQEQLRSVVLQAIGAPLVRSDITADDWIDALAGEQRRYAQGTVRVRLTRPRPLAQTLEASKSELNRALVIAAQRMGRTCIVGKSSADDVRHMYLALTQLGYPVEETEKGFVADNLNRRIDIAADDGMRTVHVGEGAATLRFLLALCSTSVKPCKLVVAPSLMRRPHEALLRSLRSGGAHIEAFNDPSGQGFVVRGWEQMPSTFSVDATESSQFASAIALLSVGTERPFTLRLLGEAVSAGYFDMTLDLLERSGVEFIRHDDLIAFNQTSRLHEKLTLEMDCDASSRAVWSAARFLGHPAEPGRKARVPRQPDGAVDRYLSRIRDADREAQVIDISDVPDLLPVLAVAALVAKHPVTFTGAARLRLKESNRLDDFATSLRAIGAAVDVTADGLTVHPSAAQLRERLFPSHGDHRLVMAGTLCTLAGGMPVRIDVPWSVTKSYPAFWDDVRAAGWTVEEAVADAS